MLSYSVYYKLDNSTSLLDNLKGKCVIEHPILWVTCREETETLFPVVTNGDIILRTNGDTSVQCTTSEDYVQCITNGGPIQANDKESIAQAHDHSSDDGCDLMINDDYNREEVSLSVSLDQSTVLDVSMNEGEYINKDQPCISECTKESVVERGDHSLTGLQMISLYSNNN